jgi:hypothetical protein
MEPAGSKIYNQKTIKEHTPEVESKYDAFKRMREALSKN